MQQVPWCNSSVPNSTEHNWHPLLVWIGQPSQLLHVNDRQNVAFLGPSKTKDFYNQSLLLGPTAATALRWIKAAHRQGNPIGSEDIWKREKNMLGNRLVKRWHWVLPAAETLHLPWWCTVLLPRWMESDPRQQSFYPSCRIEVCPNWRGGTGSSWHSWTNQDVMTWCARLDCCRGSLTTLESAQRSQTRGYQQPSSRQPQRKNAAFQIQGHTHTGQETPCHRCTFPASGRWPRR